MLQLSSSRGSCTSDKLLERVDLHWKDGLRMYENVLTVYDLLTLIKGKLLVKLSLITTHICSVLASMK